MEIKRENLPKSKVKILVKLSSSEMRGYFTRAYNKLAPQVQIQGFRPGAAPKSMVISALGENRINSEIIDIALKESYPAALKKENLLPIAPPQITIKMVKDLTADTAEMEYEAGIDLLPKIEIGDYRKIRVKSIRSKTIEVSDKEIEQVLNYLGRQSAQFEEIEGKIQNGDRVEINFEGFQKGVKLENLSSKNYPVVLGSKVLIPEFEEKLVGLKKGDKKEFSLSIAPSPNEEKKKIDFKVEIIRAQKVILPKFDDEFAKKFQKKNLGDLKKAIEEDLKKQKKEKEERELENEVLEGLLKIIKVDVPESLMNQEIDRQINEMQSRVSTFGLTFEQYLANLKKTPEELRESLKFQAEKTIKIGLALGEIAKKENIDLKSKDAGKDAIKKLIEFATK